MQKVGATGHEVHIACDGLDDYRGNALMQAFKNLLDLFNVVVIRHYRIGNGGGGHAG